HLASCLDPPQGLPLPPAFTPGLAADGCPLRDVSASLGSLGGGAESAMGPANALATGAPPLLMLTTLPTMVTPVPSMTMKPPGPLMEMAVAASIMTRSASRKSSLATDVRWPLWYQSKLLPLTICDWAPSVRERESPFTHWCASLF